MVEESQDSLFCVVARVIFSLFRCANFDLVHLHHSLLYVRTQLKATPTSWSSHLIIIVSNKFHCILPEGSIHHSGVVIHLRRHFFISSFNHLDFWWRISSLNASIFTAAYVCRTLLFDRSWRIFNQRRGTPENLPLLPDKSFISLARIHADSWQLTFITAVAHHQNKAVRSFQFLLSFNLPSTASVKELFQFPWA